MIGVPTVCNTKEDYHYIKDHNITGWRDKWAELINGRFIVSEDELIEDDNATIFRLGFSVEYVEIAIGFSGKTAREIEWMASQPDRYKYENGNWEEIPGWEQVRNNTTVAKAVAKKIAEIEAASAERQRADIAFNGHKYYADDWATKTIESCCAVASNLGLKDVDLIRVPPPLQPGYWMTAGIDASGNRALVKMTVGEMRQLSAALYDRNGAIWGKEVVHKATIEAMASGGATAAQIESYNHLEGWE